VEVLHGVRLSQSPRPRVMQGLAARLNLKRSQGRPWAGYRAAKRVEFRGADRVRFREGNILALEWLGDEEPRAVGDPMHVETSFVRNLGGLIRVRLGMPDRLMKAKAKDEHARG